MDSSGQLLEQIADQARTIRIPVHMVETINKLIRIQRQFLQDLGREPVPEELGAEMEMPSEKIRENFKDCSRTSFFRNTNW